MADTSSSPSFDEEVNCLRDFFGQCLSDPAAGATDDERQMACAGGALSKYHQTTLLRESMSRVNETAVVVAPSSGGAIVTGQVRSSRVPCGTRS